MKNNGQILDFEKITSLEVFSSFTDVMEYVEKKEFSIGDANIKNWVVRSWQENELLVGNYEIEKWRKFSFTEIVWLRVIVKLRALNVPLENIRKLKKKVFLLADFDLPVHQQQIITIISKLNVGKLTREEIKKILEKKEVKTELKKQRKPLLYYFILDAVLLKNHFSLILTSDGAFMPYKESYLEYINTIPIARKILLGSYVSISLTEIISEFISEHEINVSENQLKIITKDEAILLKYLRKENMKSIKIRFNENGKIKMLELEKEEPVKNAKNVLDFILNNGYHDISITTVKGNILKCVNTQKIKLQ
jgi:DNA-binding transcriptional MerR regulator